MKTGYWLEFDGQTKNVAINNLFNNDRNNYDDIDALDQINEFLYEYCEVFAVALHQHFGYKIEYLYDTNNQLVHAYCILSIGGKIHYIDIRGITDDWDEFIDDFKDMLPNKKRINLDIRLHSTVDYPAKNENIILNANNIATIYRQYYG